MSLPRQNAGQNAGGGTFITQFLRPPQNRGQQPIIPFGVQAQLLPSISESILPKFNWKTFTFAISMTEVLMFVITLVFGQLFYGGMFVRTNGMAGPTADCLKAMGGKWTPEICEGRLDRLVSPIILHAGFIHICSNLFFQMHFGFILEERWTSVRFAIIYFFTGVGASFLSAVANPTSVSVGASGALFGIIGANIMYLIMNWARVPGVQREMCCMILITLFNFTFGGVSGGQEVEQNIDSWAHFGGLLTGFLGAPLILPIDNVMWSMLKIRIFQIIFFALNLTFFGVLCILLWVPGQICSPVE